MSRRFYVASPLTAGTVKITDTQVHHLRNVMRANIGDEYELFDGKGNVAKAILINLDRSTASFESDAPIESQKAPTAGIDVMMPFPKKDRIQFLVEKLTELGVKRLLPVITKRSVFEPKACTSGKLERYVIEACKQCGRNDLMEIGEPDSYEKAINSCELDSIEFDEKSSQTKFIAAFDGVAAASLVKDFEKNTSSKNIVVLVGPEGGFTDDEIQKAINVGFQKVGLGHNVLRMETAAIVLGGMIASGISTTKLQS